MIVNDKLHNDYTAIFVTLHNWTSFLLPNWYLRIITYKYKYIKAEEKNPVKVNS